MNTTTEQTRKRGRPKNSGKNIPLERLAALKAQGLSYQAIADQFNVSLSFVSKALNQHARQQMNQATESGRLERFNAAVNAGDPFAIELLNQFQPDILNVTLDITGKAPLRFQGFLLREGSTEFIDAKPDKPNSDYWTLKIYRVNEPKEFQYALATVYTSIVKKQAQQLFAAHFTNDPAADIQAYDPLTVLRGYPPIERFAAMQQRLERAIKFQYGKLVSDILRRSL